ncbi:hypothetical protein N665_1171s0001 [Sinapis alba]|nr:hypothetical protein N665_1171s0001 [Sinapis alba]
MVEVGDGKKGSFWNEVWSPLGCLNDLLGNRGYIDIGITIDARIADCSNHRRRTHRVPVFNEIEEEIEKVRGKMQQGVEDTSLWKTSSGKFKRNFSTSETWEIIREKYSVYETPKYSFFVWLAVRNRLSTGDRMKNWYGSVDSSCIFCKAPVDTVEHLFFECSFSKVIWDELMKGVLGDRYTANWSEILRLLTRPGQDNTHAYTIRYLFQATLHSSWRERNKRKHGETESPSTILIKLIDRTVRNRLSIVKKLKENGLEGGLRYWFATRQS